MDGETPWLVTRARGGTVQDPERCSNEADEHGELHLRKPLGQFIIKYWSDAPTLTIPRNLAQHQI